MPFNSASRIHAVLTTARSVAGNQPAINAWAKAFNVTSDETAACVAPHLLDLIDELNEAERLTREKLNEETATVRLRYFPVLRKVLTFHEIQGNWQLTSQLLSTEVLYSLENLAVDLDSEAEIPKDEMAAIEKAVSELFAMVEKSDINKKLKLFILSWLSKIRRGLERYRITGTRGLQDALIEIQGEGSIFQKPVVEEIKKESPTIWSRIQGLIVMSAKAAEFGERLKKIYEVTSPFFKLTYHFMGIESSSIDLPAIEDKT